MTQTFTLLILALTLLIGCSQEDELERAIHSARVYLSSKQCQKAISTLEGVTADNTNAKYVQTLSSAYACRADYSTPVFYGTNVSRINGTNTLGSLTTFTTSVMVGPNDADYEDLQTAIDLLRFAGDIRIPTSSERAKVFSDDDASNINLQLWYMLVTQIGKYVFYYGNADPTTGTKGGGNILNGNPNNLNNDCFYSYNPSDVVLEAGLVALLPAGSCTAANYQTSGHIKLLQLPNTNTVTRMCQGVILFNAFIDVLLNTVIPDDANELADLSSIFSTACTSFAEFTGDICNVNKLSDCEDDYAVAPGSDQLQAYFFLVYEQLFV